jgi:secreted trypsin-like serine protease
MFDFRAGWGTVDVNVLKMSTVLRVGEMKILRPEKCPAATNMNNLYNFQSMICAYSEKHVDTCQGDSGGVIFIHFCNVFKFSTKKKLFFSLYLSKTT